MLLSKNEIDLLHNTVQLSLTTYTPRIKTDLDLEPR